LVVGEEVYLEDRHGQVERYAIATVAVSVVASPGTAGCKPGLHPHRRALSEGLNHYLRNRGLDGGHALIERLRHQVDREAAALHQVVDRQHGA
jgi:hypothetical protein